jgi:proteic killer suppression protein
MIRSFKDKETEKIWNQTRSPKFSYEVQRLALRKLFMIHHSQTLNDLQTPPANRLKKLKGGREGQYSIRINDQYRICFVWKNDDAHDVEIIDYH